MGVFDFIFGKKGNTKEPQDQSDLLTKVEVVPGLRIPKAFAGHWQSIEKDKISSISINADPKDGLALEQSKFGHYPCMPAGFDYPKDAEGRYMYPLAQINFAEVPQLAGYPDSGYLQFYISGFDDVYGLDFDNPQSQKNFRVLYFEESEVQNYKADFSFLDEVLESDMSPVHRPHALHFTKKDEYAGMGDARYENGSKANLLKIAEQYPAIKDELEESLYDSFQANGHKIGGYAYFTQTDPRGYNDKFRNYVLLFQIDSGDDIMWGDVGVANFFIHPDDLAKKDFSKVMYNWDCC
jgi:uncharacterized protein YwqG